MEHGWRRVAVICGTTVVLLACAATANAYVYWVANTTHAIGRANLDATGVNHAFITTTTPAALAVDQGHIYWGNGSAIGRANLNGTGADGSWLPVPGVSQIAAIVTDGTYIYWDSAGTTIGRARLDGTVVQPNFITAAGLSAGALAIAGGMLYYNDGPSIESAPVTGGPSTLFLTASGLPAPQILSLAAANGNIYWSELKGASGLVETSPLGSANESTLVSGPYLPADVASDGTYLYWVEGGPIGQPDQIARALLSGNTVSNIINDFVSEPNTTYDIAVDTGIDPTSTSVKCTPTVVAPGAASACTATVTDAASSAPPTGTINFSGPAAFFSGAPCQLTHTVGAGASCTVGANLTVPGPQAITASYSGDSSHRASAGAATICSGAKCAAKPPPGCTVPKLKGKTLAQGRTLLSRAHCRLGQVRRPKHARGPLLISSTTPQAGRTLPAGTKVAIKLAPAPRRRHRR